MPNLDKTGPRGEGPKTGRQMGNCADEKKRCLDDKNCSNGIRKRCCLQANKEFYEKRARGRNVQSNTNDSNK